MKTWDISIHWFILRRNGEKSQIVFFVLFEKSVKYNKHIVEVASALLVPLNNQRQGSL